MKHQPHYTATHVALLLLSSLAAAGCTSPDSDAALEAYALTAQEPEQETSEVVLGNYMISVPVKLIDHDAWYRVSFDLAINVAQHDIDTATESVQKNESRVRQAVADVIRQSATEDLENARLSEVRLRLLDTINQQLGDRLATEVYLANFGTEVQ